MDLSLHWGAALPRPLAGLLDVLVALPEAESAGDGDVVLCPDATAIAPPEDRPGAALVGFVGGIGRLGDAAGRRQLAVSLNAWAARGARFVVPHRKAAGDLAALLGIAPERVCALPLPLPADGVPTDAAAEPADRPRRDIVVVDDGLRPGQLDDVIGAFALARRFGAGDARLVVPARVGAHLALPGSPVGMLGLMGGSDVVAAGRWTDALPSAAAVLLLGVEPDLAWTLRQALATGVPVLAPSGPVTAAHLDALGAPAYVYGLEQHQLADALHAAVLGHRGPDVGPQARAAVLAETTERAALALLNILTGAVAAGRGSVSGARVEVVPSARDGLAVGVINPHPSAGGGERFLRHIVGALADHPSRPRVTLVCQEDPQRTFDAGLADLRARGVEVHQAPADRLEQVYAEVTAGRDVTYCPWPHLASPPQVDGPLVCTFHDVNWRHFDVLSPEQKRALDEQTPQWLERSDAVIHSSRFIADEVARFFGPDYPAHVIPLTADLGGDPIDDAERAALRARHALPQRFLFSPAGRHLHKNYAVLAAACRRLRAEGRPVSVVATGAATDLAFHGPDLVGLGYVSGRDISVLYDLSCGVVQTSLYEAGSWPMIEAMDALRPVACSRIPSIVEQVERIGLDAELFDPTSVEDVAASLAALWDGRSAGADADAIAANAAAVRALQWSEVGDAYLRVLQGAVDRHRTAAPLASADAR